MYEAVLPTYWILYYKYVVVVSNLFSYVHPYLGEVPCFAYLLYVFLKDVETTYRLCDGMIKHYHPWSPGIKTIARYPG